jgi:asparagine synthase (glutamine-hydrolysing)
MCGISVICGQGHAGATMDRLRRMHDRIAHRGPDGEGWLAVDRDWRVHTAPTEDGLRNALGDRPVRIAAAFRRLAIQHLGPAGTQPMASPRGDRWILFNGEVYNHADLRQEIAAAGGGIAGPSDTAVFLAAYELWGTDCFARLDGMWAAVVVDVVLRRLVVSRDRFGIRPLCYRMAGGDLLFGSEAKQLRDGTGVNRRAVLGLALGRRPDVDETCFEGVSNVPSASWAAVNLAATLEVPRFAPYWHVATSARSLTVNAAEAADRVERALSQAVALQAAAAVPVGALLSGGLDSSLVSSMLCDQRCRDHRDTSLITISPEGATGADDERPFAKAMATSLASQAGCAVEASIDAGWVDREFDKVTWHQEAPIYGAAVVGQYRAYQVAREAGLKVVLDGTGADELFGGYHRHQFARFLDDWRDRHRTQSLSALALSFIVDPSFRWYVSDWAQQGIRRRLLPARRRRVRWLTGEALTLLLRPPRNGAGPPTFERMVADDVTSGTLPAALTVGDRNAMAHGIESRVPFLSHHLVETAIGLPARARTDGTRRKIVLRDVARRRLPPVIWKRRARIGFGMPMAAWLRGPLRERMRAAARDETFLATGWIDRAGAISVVDDFLDRRHDDAASVWRIFALSRWLSLFSRS